MPKGISLHLGLNSVDPKHYAGWDGQLTACEFDAKDMRTIAKKAGFKTQLLLTAKAKSQAVIRAISDAAEELKRGDIFFLTYSGHGGQVPDLNGDDSEDGQDETWVLHDRELVDDELYALWGKFRNGVRILMLSDSCHSGTVARFMPVYTNLRGAAGAEQPPRYRVMPPKIRDATYKKNKKLYDGIQKRYPAGENVAVGASVILISGCRDNQLSSDGDRNGLFTETLLNIWKGGKFKRGYAAFQKTIERQMPPYQDPNLFFTGVRNPDFERQSPFTI